MRSRALKYAIVLVVLVATFAVASASLFPHLHSAPSCQVCLAGHIPFESPGGTVLRLHAPEYSERLAADYHPAPGAAPPYSSIPSRAPPA